MRSLAMVAVALLVLAAPVRADEEAVPLDKVPKPVLEAAKKRFPKAEVVGASKETEKDKTVYEIEMKEAGKTIDVTLTPEGVITTIEKQIDAKDLPKPVGEALEKKYPKATYKVIESVTAVKDKKETLEYYEAHLVTAEKKEIEVEIFPDGKIKAEEEKKPEKKDEKKPSPRDDEKKGKKNDDDDDDDKNEKGNKGANLPKVVLEAVKSKFPGGKVVGASKEGKGEKTVYEVELRYKATTLEVLLTPKGEVVEVEVKGKEKDDEKGEKNEKGKNEKGKKEDDQRGFQGEQKGQHEDKDDKKGENKKGKKDEGDKNEKGKKKKGEDD